MPKIVIAEDIPELRVEIQTFLESLGFVVHSAQNGSEALRLCLEQQVDLVISDLHMPIFNGLELALGLRELKTTVPMILITGNQMVTETHYKSLGIEAVLSKPFSLRQLQTAMQPLLPSFKFPINSFSS